LGSTSMYFAYYSAEATLNANGDPKTVAAAAFAFALQSYAAFEFEDRDGVPGFQFTNASNRDILTGFYNLSSPLLAWKPISVNETTVTGPQGDFKVHTFTAETLDEVFLLRLVVTGNPIMVNGVRISPDQIKVDFAIRWFDNPKHVLAPWTLGFSNSTTANVGMFALYAAAAAAVGVVNGDANNSPALQVKSGAFVGAFSWAPTANSMVQGVEANAVVRADFIDLNSNPDVKAAFIAGWTIKFVAFTFNASRPTEVLWDPVFGASIDYAQMQGASVMTVPAFFVISLLVAALFH